MKHVAVIYWSGTGNTKKMAEAVAEGVKSQGAQVRLLSVEEASLSDITNASAVALGCPSMGAEVLEESYMEPFVAEVEMAKHSSKPLALFGSYDWGGGEWMRDWEARMSACSFNLVADGLTVRNEPSAEAINLCQLLGVKLAGSL
ncbi:MAG: flavodoxin [Thermaerobacter sp.]|nr:flavodoxin [Thermaerobacter sp.]